jgi:ACS family D-galactonate transporter-like MFS transporter
VTNVRMRIVLLLLVAIVINYTDRVNLSYAAPMFMKQFHMGHAGMGIVLSAFLWTYFLVQIPMGLALDRLGVRWLYGAAAVVWGGATMLTATATGLGSLVGWRVLLGVGEGPAFPATTKVMGIWVADQERGLAASIAGVAGIPIGVFISSPFIGWLLAAYGWHSIFIVTGSVALLWAIVWVIYYRNPEDHPGANEVERRFLVENIAKISRTDTVERASWKQLLSNRNVLGLSLGHAAMLFNLYFLLSWLPTYLIEQRHLSTLHTGIYGSIPWLFGLLGVIVGGRGSDILIKRGWPIIKARKVFLVLGMLLAMSCLLSTFVASLTAAIAYLSLAVFGIFLTNSVVWAANAEVSPLRQGGVVAAIENCFGNVGGLLAPVIVGFLLQATGSWAVPMAAAAVVALVGAGIYLFMLSDDALFVKSEAA